LDEGRGVGIGGVDGLFAVDSPDDVGHGAL
jgi:hypothetical protein